MVFCNDEIYEQKKLSWKRYFEPYSNCVQETLNEFLPYRFDNKPRLLLVGVPACNGSKLDFV